MKIGFTFFQSIFDLLGVFKVFLEFPNISKIARNHLIRKILGNSLFTQLHLPSLSYNWARFLFHLESMTGGTQSLFLFLFSFFFLPSSFSLFLFLQPLAGA